ncbi:hypothetical protein AVEN_7839-1 [Araneus ventricosus]|uniref:Uncharacterized protein n=1 Tax=Araneus ventricosus TaxID=182803 RepID=A0A4Y2F379_ARAVE|nr:hypothetical protein AVEN_7839-1 [Araneus ventricosus]
MKLWTIEHHVSTYDCFVKNIESVTAVQCEFRRHFSNHRNQAVSTRVTILRWVLALRTRYTLMRKRPSRTTRKIRIPENIRFLSPVILLRKSSGGENSRTSRIMEDEVYS